MDIDEGILATLRAMKDERKTPVEMLEWLVQAFENVPPPAPLTINWACFLAFRQAFGLGIHPTSAIIGWTRFGRWNVTDANLNQWLAEAIYK
jgi:hypothetical protein